MNTRNFGLDFLRATAIFLVMWGHGLDFLPIAGSFEFLYYKPFDGVDLFFVLSGFLIGRLLLRELQWHPNGGLKPWARFVARRWLRTIPAYWTVLLVLWVALFIQPHWAEKEVDFLSYLFFYQNLLQPLIGFFWESWSLSVEEWFYLCSPLAVFVTAMILPARRAYVMIAVSMIAFSLMYRHTHYDPGRDDFWFDVGLRKMVFTRFDGLGCGMLLAAWMQHPWIKEYKRLWFILGLSILLGLSAVDIDNTLYFKQVFYFFIVAIALALLFPWVKDWPWKESMFNRVVRSVAIHSYGLYLVNLSLVSSILHDAEKNYANAPKWLWFALFWMLSWALAMLLHRCVEKPVMRWRDKHLNS